MNSETPTLESVPIVKEFSQVFLNYLPIVPPQREIDISIDLLPNTQPIFIPLCHIALGKLKELKDQLNDVLD